MTSANASIEGQTIFFRAGCNMAKSPTSTELVHTEVCQEVCVVSEFFALFRHEMKIRNIGTCQLAGMLDWHRNRVSRLLNHPESAKAGDLVAICEVLDLDSSVATFAIATMADWSAYYDPALQVSVSLLGRVVSKINERRTCEIELLPPAAIEILTDWIVQTIIDNQQQICSRREAIPALPQML